MNGNKDAEQEQNSMDTKPIPTNPLKEEKSNLTDTKTTPTSPQKEQEPSSTDAKPIPTSPHKEQEQNSTDMKPIPTTPHKEQEPNSTDTKPTPTSPHKDKEPDSTDAKPIPTSPHKEHEQNSTDTKTIPSSPFTEPEKEIRREEEKLLDEGVLKATVEKKKKNVGKAIGNFLYDPRRKTVLGRSALNWAKLAGFYTIFYFCLGCFFVGLLWLFSLLLDRDMPRHVNQDSTMAVRTSATVVGLGFRPQPEVDDSLIQVTNDRDQQERIARSLQLYRDVFLVQKPDAKTEVCSREDPAMDLPKGTACTFDWYDIVKSEDHPCSDRNLFGFKKEQPCVLVKINKVYDWTPDPGPVPVHIQKIRGVASDKTETNSGVYVTCAGSNPADNDVLKDMVYYSIGDPEGSPNYGVIPNYYFPYRNARDHVQPFVLVQFKSLPLDRLVSITCRLWAPGIQQDAKAMRGMVNFQLHRSH